MELKKIEVKGQTIDNETRCVHYHSKRDVIAIKFHCCDEYYPCYECHEATADHPISVWPRSLFGEKAILCGVCKKELTIHEYLTCDSTCPSCHTAFNPGCQLHYHLYFQGKEAIE